ncbi:MAG: hypothetical protein U9Q27_02105 [Patescibacteria group bacterium]|nr:hypothetical protein [Patescibacteria group bacterium]
MNKKHKYCFQNKKTNFTKKLFEQGLNASSYILFAVKDLNNDFNNLFHDVFLEELFDNYPGFQIMKAMFGHNKRKKFDKKIIKVNISRLEKQGLIRKTENKKFQLTAEGEEMIAYIKNRYSILNKKWDKKIRVVVFDIPERERHFRKWFRTELGLLLFKQLQKSVYVGKYPIPDDLYQDIIKNKFFNNIHIFTINEADKQKDLIKFLKE